MAATNDKIIRIRSDMNGALQDVAKLQKAYTSLGGTNPALASMVNNLNNAQGATIGVGGAMNAANNNTKSLIGSFGGLGNAANAAMSRLSGMTGALGGIATAGAALGLTAIAGGLIALGSAAVKASAEMQAYRASLTTVLGDSDKAAQAMGRLVEFAQKTPFSLNQAVEGFIKLKALGLQPTEAAMLSYGNTASAMGKDLNQMVEAVADASTSEFERLKEFGIKSKVEGDKVAFTFQNVTTKIGNNSTEIQAYLMAIGNTQFAGAMEKQMQTFGGALSNLEDTWNQTLAAIGDAGLASSVAGMVNMISEGITSITPLLVSVGNAMSGMVSGIGSILGGIGDLFSSINTGGGSGVSIMENLTFQFNMIGEVAQVIGAIVGGVFSAIGSAINGASSMLIGNMGAALDWLGIKWESSGRSWTNSLFGVLRGAKVVAMQLPAIFQIAIRDLLGMFSTLGQAITALLSGQWDKAKALASKPLFSNTGRAINAAGRMGVTTYNDEAGADRAMNRMLGRGTKSKGASLDDLAGPVAKPTPSAGKDSGADKAAKAAADRAKRENDFWQALKDQATAAGMLTLQSEQYNKGLELRKILERDITTAEQSRIATALGELNTAKAITVLKQRAFEAQNEYTVELGRAKGLADQQRSVEDDLFKARVEAKNRGVDIDATAYKLAENDLRTQLEKNAALKEQNELMRKAQDFAISMSAGAKSANDLKQLNAQYKAYTDSVATGEMSGTFRDQIVAGYQNAKLKIEQDAIRVLLDMSPTADRNARIATENGKYNEGMAQLAKLDLAPEARKQIEGEIYDAHKTALGKIAAETTRDWVDMFDDLADTFGGKLGGVLGKFADGFENIAEMMSGKLTGPAGAFAKLFKTEGTYRDTANEFSLPKFGEAIKSPLSSLSKGFGDFKSMFSTDLATGLTKGLTKMQAGAQVGGMVAGVGDLLGLGKGFSKGSQIGGAVGGLFGPVGSIIGSIGGGVLGKLFGGKTNQASASLSVVDGKAVGGVGVGSGSAEKGTAGALAGSVAEGLNKVAAELGGSIGSLSGVSIGYRPGHKAGAYRVDENGTGKLTGVAAFETEAEAIAYAIKNAIADGAITGLAPIVQKALAGLGAESAIQFAKDWNAAMDDYKSLTDPVGSAVDSIIKPLNTLRDTMVKVGASTDDLTKMDEYRTLKLKTALKEQLSSLTDFLAALKGEGSGVTKMDQLNAKMAEFDTFKARIANGDSSIDQSAFTSLGQSIFSLAGDIYGTATGQFQDIRNMLTGTTQNLADNVTNGFNSAAGFDVTKVTAATDTTTAAIQAQAVAQAAHYQAQANSNAIQESYLKQIAASLANNNGGTVKVANDDVAYNGQYMGRTY